MKPFWRAEALSPAELELIDALSQAHYQSSFRSNPSTVALQCAAQGSGDLCRSVAAALLTFGERHGPIEATYEILENQYSPDAMVENYLERKVKIPGWGSSFTQDTQADPIWKPVDDVLLKSFEPVRWHMMKITQALHDRDIKILPNPSAYTAVSAIALKMPKHLAPYLLIMGRMAAWAEIFANELKGT